MVSADALATMQPVLLAHGRQLTGDRAAAEDLLQDALVRMLVAPPKSDRPSSVKAWLKVTMRNLFVDQRRLEAHAPELVTLDDPLFRDTDD